MTIGTDISAQITVKPGRPSLLSFSTTIGVENYHSMQPGHYDRTAASTASLVEPRL